MELKRNPKPLQLRDINTDEGIKNLNDIHDWWNYGINPITGWRNSNFKVYHAKRNEGMQSVNLHAIKREIKAMPK